MLKYSLFAIVLGTMFFLSCSKDETTGIVEIFDSIDRPFFSYEEELDQYILEPWNYNKDYNKDRKYPLVIFLHGSGGAGNISYLSHLGYDNPDDSYENETALNFQKTHPSFVLVPQTYGGWDYASLVEQVEGFKAKYRIDDNRVYLIGYSMGGSGSYAFMNNYYDYNGHLFAGLIRLAGQSQTSVREAIAENTDIWLHIGLEDLQLRVDVTREAYQFLKDYHPQSEESVTQVPIPDITGETYTLKINREDRFKRTEYEGVGHGVSTLPFKDPYLIQWLFSKRL